MRILLSLLGAVAITSSSASFAGSNVFVGQQIATEKQKIETQKNDEIDWKLLDETTSNYFDNFKEQQQKLFSNNPSQIEEMNQAINYAQEVSQSYLQKFAEQNSSLEEIINQISTDFPQFKTYYENPSNQITEFNNLDFGDSLSKDKSLPSTSNYSTPSFDQLKEDLRRILSDIRAWKVIASTITAAAAVAAAAFWAAAWWLGASIPWAIACSTIATITGLITSVLGRAVDYAESHQSPMTWQDSWSFLSAVIQDALGNGLAGLKSKLSVLRWAFMVVDAVIDVFNAVDDWTDYIDHISAPAPIG